MEILTDGTIYAILAHIFFITYIIKQEVTNERL